MQEGVIISLLCKKGLDIEYTQSEEVLLCRRGWTSSAPNQKRFSNARRARHRKHPITGVSPMHEGVSH